MRMVFTSRASAKKQLLSYEISIAFGEQLLTFAASSSSRCIHRCALTAECVALGR